MRMLTLTKRERDVLRLLAEGMRGRPHALDSARTCSAMAKLKCDTRTQAVAVALRESLISWARVLRRPWRSRARAPHGRGRHLGQRRPLGRWPTSRSAVEARKALDHAGVELGAGAAEDLLPGLLYRPRSLYGRQLRERVEDIGHADDPAGQRDVLTGEAVGVPAPSQR